MAAAGPAAHTAAPSSTTAAPAATAARRIRLRKPPPFPARMLVNWLIGGLPAQSGAATASVLGGRGGVCGPGNSGSVTLLTLHDERGTASAHSNRAGGSEWQGCARTLAGLPRASRRSFTSTGPATAAHAAGRT